MITTIEKGVKDFAWSKDGKYLSFSSFNVYEPDWEIEIPGKVDGQDYSWTKEPNVVTTMHWKSDGRGEYESGENHIYLVNADGGAPIKLTSFGMDYVGDLQWLDSQTLLFSGNNSLNDLKTPWKQTGVFTLNIKNKKLTKISPKEGVFSTPKGSEDGTKIVYLGHPNTEYSSVAFDVWIHSKNKNKVLTNNLPSSPGELFWLSNNQIAFDIDERGSSKIMELNINTKELNEVISDFNDQFYLSSTANSTYYGVYTLIPCVLGKLHLSLMAVLKN